MPGDRNKQGQHSGYQKIAPEQDGKCSGVIKAKLCPDKARTLENDEGSTQQWQA